MNKMFLYYYGLKKYYKTEKGRRDGLDFLKALGIIVLVILAIMMAVFLLEGAVI